MPKTALLILFIAAIARADAPAGIRIAKAAEAQVGVTTIYDASYKQLRYPGGDLPPNRGVCADVIVRAFRQIGVDLQVGVHEDMRQNFAAYPQKWGLRSPDTNIDHRRVPNLMRYFERKGKSTRDAFKPGDIVAWRLSNGLYHIGVVSTRRGATDFSVVHNIGYGALNEDVLRAFEIIGHFRW
ncbi:MAG TPA: DUF1287 domain-containing protein [Thermoanaerobaculia bacterium]|nr:DUF1287 domain-containing protein [Thermoanaerobaculia bacterium]